MCDWRSVSRSSYECAVSPLPGSTLCILHAPCPKDWAAFREKLVEQMEAIVNREELNHRWDFTGYVFPRGYTLRLSYITIDQTLVFDEAVVNGAVYLTDAELKDGIHIWNSEFLDRFVCDGATLHGPLVVSGTLFRESLEMRNTEFRSFVTINTTSARELILGNERPTILGWNRRGIRQPRQRDRPSFWHFAAEQYGQEGKHNRADAAHYFERIALWRKLRAPGIALQVLRSEDRRHGRCLFASWTRARLEVLQFMRWSWLAMLSALEGLFVRWTTAYGASLSRLFLTWATVIFGFGVAFSLRPDLIGQSESHMATTDRWLDGIHYSVTTFATLGLGDLSPGESALGKVLTSIEALLGAVLIALAVLVLGRRFMRQG